MGVLGVICDVGGTILDTNALHRGAWESALSALDLLTPATLAVAYSGLSSGLDSHAIASSITADAESALRLAREKQSRARAARSAVSCPATIDWLLARPRSARAAISHSDEHWTRGMLQSAGVLDMFAFTLGRRDGAEVSKPDLAATARDLLARTRAASEFAYLGDTPLDAEIARVLGCDFVDVSRL